MKIDLTQNLYGANGSVLTTDDGNGNPVSPTLDVILKNVALTDVKDEDKVTDFNIFVKLNQYEKSIDLSNTELVRLQNKLPEIYGILIYGQINAILEGKENPLKPKE